MATMKTLNGYGFNATELNGKTSDSYLQLGDDEAGSTGEAPKINADTLGGVDASNYLKKNDTASDTSKLGGKAPEYYIQPRNLLDNSDFRNPVNQRGKSEYSNVAYTYTIDRWKTLDSGSVTVANGYIVTTNHLVQFMPKNLNGIYTAAAKMLDGTLLIASGAIDTLSIGDGNTIQAGNDGAMSYFALRKAGSFLWAALYEGAYTANTLPPYVPKGYAAELAECQRYYQIIRLYRHLSAIYDNQYRYYGCSLPVKMRTTPTVTIEFMEECKVNNFDKNSLTSYSGESYKSFEGMAIAFVCISEPSTVLSQCYVNTKIACSADL